jgi:hypothetical protein
VQYTLNSGPSQAVNTLPPLYAHRTGARGRNRIPKNTLLQSEAERSGRRETRAASKSTGMGEAPCMCIPAPGRFAAQHFRLPRHGRRKLHVVRIGSGGGARVHARGGRGHGLRRWLRRAVWRLTELCVAALSSGGLGAAKASDPTPWAGIEPCFAAPFVPVATMVRRARAQD